MDNAPPRGKRRLPLRLLRIAAWIVLPPVLFVLSAWAVLAVFFSNLPAPWMRTTAAVIWGIAALWALLMLRPRWKGLAVFAALWLGVVTWHWLIPATNSGDWQPDVAQVVTAVVEGDKLTVRNVRNCTYRSETDYDAKWEERTYDLTKLQAMDLMFVYWGSPLIAHAMVSFEFEDPSAPGGLSYLCASIETRKLKGQGYSAVKGMFKQFALIYTIGDERDLIGLRTHFRKEQVYIYRLGGSQQYRRAMLMSYMNRANRMAEHPEWYNALTSSCFTNILFQSREVNENRIPWYQMIDSRVVFDGGFDTFLYEQQKINTGKPFEEIRRLSLVNAKVDAAPIGPDFSLKIREGLPSRPGAPASK